MNIIRFYKFVPTADNISLLLHFLNCAKLSLIFHLQKVKKYSYIFAPSPFRHKNHLSSVKQLAEALNVYHQAAFLLLNPLSIWSGWAKDRRGQEEKVEEQRRPEEADATTVALALWDINSPEPYWASLIGNVSAVMLCATMACEHQNETSRGVRN